MVGVADWTGGFPGVSDSQPFRSSGVRRASSDARRHCFKRDYGFGGTFNPKRNINATSAGSHWCGAPLAIASDFAGSGGVGAVTVCGPLFGLLVESVSTLPSDGAAATRIVKAAVPNLSLIVAST